MKDAPDRSYFLTVALLTVIGISNVLYFADARPSTSLLDFIGLLIGIAVVIIGSSSLIKGYLKLRSHKQ